MADKQPERFKLGDRGDKGTHYGVAAIALGMGVFAWWITGDPSSPPEIPKPIFHKGAVIDTPITLVTADKTDLACASETEFEGYHCAFKKQDEAWPGLDTTNPEHRKKMLVPYMTVDNVMFLIPGLFEDPAVDERYRDELPKRRPRDKLERFTAQCKLELKTEFKDVKARWRPDGSWENNSSAWVGVASACQVSEP